MTEGSFTPEAPRPVAPQTERPRSEAISQEQLKARVQRVVGEIDQARKNSPQTAKHLEQMQTAASRGESQQGTSSHQALQELAQGNVSRVTRLNRFIYAAVERAQGDVPRAMQQLQESAANGALYNVGENLIDNQKRLERVCKAADVDYQTVQQKAADYATSLGEALTPDQMLAMQIVAFRDLLTAQLGDKTKIQEAHARVSQSMTKEGLKERYERMTGKELTIENVIAAPRNISQEQKVSSQEERFTNEIEGLYKDMDIHIEIGGKEISFAEITQVSDGQLADAIRTSLQKNDDPSRVLKARIDAIQQLRNHGRSLLAGSKGTNDEAYTRILQQQVRLIKLANAHDEALRQQEPQGNPMPAAA